MHLHLHGCILLLTIAVGYAHAYSITAEHANAKSGAIASSEQGFLSVGNGPGQSASGGYSKSQSASFASAGESSFSFHATGDKLDISPEIAGSLKQNYYVGAPGCNQKACNPRSTQMNMVTDSYDEGDDGQYHEKEEGQYQEDDGQYHGEYQEKDDAQYQEDLGQYQEHDDGQYRDPFINQGMMQISNIPVPVHTPYFNMPASGGQINGVTISQSSHYGGGFGGPPGILSPYDKRIPANEAPNPDNAEMNMQIGNRMQAADMQPSSQSLAPMRPMTLGGFDGPPGILSPYDVPVPANKDGYTQKPFNNPAKPIEPSYVPNKPGNPNRHNLPPFIPPQGLPTVPPNQPAVHYDGDHDGKTGVLIAIPYHPQGPPNPQQGYGGNPTTPQVQYTGTFDGPSGVLRPLETNSGSRTPGAPEQGYSHGASPTAGATNNPYTGDFGGAPGVLKPSPGTPSQGTPPTPSVAPGYQTYNPNQHGINQIPGAPNIPYTGHFNGPPGILKPSPGLSSQGTPPTSPVTSEYQPYNPNQYGPQQTPGAPNVQYTGDFTIPPGMSKPSLGIPSQGSQPTPNNPNQYGPNQTPAAPDVQFTGDFNAPPGILKPSTSYSPEMHGSRPAPPKQPGYSHSVHPTDAPNIPYTGDFGGAPGIIKPSPETHGTTPGSHHYHPIQPGYANGAYPSPDAPNIPYTGDFGGAPGVLNPSPETPSRGPYKPNFDVAPESIKPGPNTQLPSSGLPTYRPSLAPGSQSYEPSKPDYSPGLENPTPGAQFNTATAPETSKPSDLGGQQNLYAFPPNYSDYNQFGGPSITHGKPPQTPEYGNNVEKPLGTLQPPKFNSPNQEPQHGEGGLSRIPSLKPTGDTSLAYNQGQYSTTPSHIEYTGDFGGPAGILRPNVPPNFPPRQSQASSTPGHNDNSGRTPFDQPTSYSHTIAVPVVPDSQYGGQPAYGRSAGKETSKLSSDTNTQTPDYTPQKPGSCSGDFCGPRPGNVPENPTTANDNGFDTPILKQSQDIKKQTACGGNTCETPIQPDSTKPGTLPMQPNQQRKPQKSGYGTSFDTPQESPKPSRPSGPKSSQCNGDNCGSGSSRSNAPNTSTSYPNTITVPLVPDKQDRDSYAGPTTEPKSEKPTHVGKPYNPGYSRGFDNPQDHQCNGYSCGIPNGPHSDKNKPGKPDQRNPQRPKPSGYDNPQEILKDVQKPTQCVGDFCGLPSGPDYNDETPGKLPYSGTSQTPASGSGFDATRGTSRPTPAKDIQKPTQCNGDSCGVTPDTKEDLKKPLNIPINNQDTDGPTAKPKSNENPRRPGFINASDHPKDGQKSHLGKCSGDSCEIESDSDVSLNRKKNPQSNKPEDQTTVTVPVVSDTQDTDDYGTESKEIALGKPEKPDFGKTKPGSGNPTQCSGTSCGLGPDSDKSEKQSPTGIPKRGNKKPDSQCVGDCGGILSLPEDDYTDEFENDDQQQQQQQWGDDIQYTEGFPCTGDCSNNKPNTDKNPSSDRETDKRKSPNCTGNDCPAPKPKQTLELPIADSGKDDSNAKADEFYNSFEPAPAPTPVPSANKKPEVDSHVQENDDDEEFSNRDQSAVYDQQIQEGGCDGGDCQKNLKNDKQTKLNDYDSAVASSDMHEVGCSGGCPQAQQGISNGFAFAGTQAGSFVGGKADNHVLNKIFSGINSALGLSSSSGSYAYSGSHASAGAFTGTGDYSSRPHRSARRFFYFF